MKISANLILGEAVYISIVYRVPDSWLYSFNGYEFSFHHLGENREYANVFGSERDSRFVSRKLSRNTHRAIRTAWLESSVIN